MSAVLAWIKSNVASVIFIVVIIAALVTLPLLSSRLNESVRTDMDERVRKLKELDKLEKTSVTVGNAIRGETISKTVLVNERLLNRLREVTGTENEDADRVMEAALRHNRKGRTVLLAELFPEPPPAQREVLPERFHGRLENAYEALLQRINAGSPPTPESLSDEIERRRLQFINQELQRDADEDLEPEEADRLREVLTEQRMSRYAEEAEGMSLYADGDAIHVPVWEQANQPTLAELYEWQWQYWIIDDVLEALADANRDESGELQSVLLAPVKRVLEVTVYANAGVGAGGTPGPSNPAQEVKPDFTVSFTGRASNPLYDVRDVRMRIIVDTARLPEVMDALARRNFITTIDFGLLQADPYAAVKDGYFYGAEPVSEIVLDLETVWLREWTTPYMPPDVRAALGIADPAENSG